MENTGVKSKKLGNKLFLDTDYGICYNKSNLKDQEKGIPPFSGEKEMITCLNYQYLF